MKKLIILFAAFIILQLNLFAQEETSKGKRHNLQWQFTDLLSSENTFSYEYNFLNSGLSLVYAYGFRNNIMEEKIKSRSHELQLRSYLGVNILGKSTAQKNEGVYFGIYHKARKSVSKYTHFSYSFFGTSDPSDTYLEYLSIHKTGMMTGYKFVIKESLTIDALFAFESRMVEKTFSDDQNTKNVHHPSPRVAISMGWIF